MQAQPRSSLPTLLLTALLMLGLGGAGAWYFLKQKDAGTSDQSVTLAPGEIFLQPAGEVGPDPFSAAPLASPPDPTLAAPVVATAVAVKPPPQAPVQAASGAKPGLYGGSSNDAACNVPQLVSFLGTNAEKAAAWVAALNADPTLRFSGGTLTTANIPAFISSLTPIVLLADTRVTNHGFKAGSATPRQDVLQKGTAVLIDPFGVPRARCFCGNPLLPPVPSSVAVTYVGRSWAGFNPANVSVVSPAPQPQTSFQVTGPGGTIIQVTVGSPPGQPAAAASAGAATPAQAAALGSPSSAAASPGTPAVAATTPGTGTAAAAAPIGTPYTMQLAADPNGRISMSVPTGWETETQWSWDDLGGTRQYFQMFRALPSLALAKDPANAYAQPEVRVEHVWPTTPGQPLDVNAVMDARKSTLCSIAGSPQATSHPKFGAGTSVTNTGCTGNATAELQSIAFPQPDGSVFVVKTKVLEARDRDLINKILDTLTLPKVSAPAPIVVNQQQCSTSPQNAPPVDISIVNNTTELLRVVWHDYKCQLDLANFQWIVAPGQSTSIPGTYEGNVYTAVALDSSTVGIYTVPAGGGTWTLP